MIETYNAEVARWAQRADRNANLDDFVISDDTVIKWSSELETGVAKKQIAEFAEHKVRQSLYRPFTKSHLFFDRIMNNESAYFPSIFPTPEVEKENRVILSVELGVINFFRF